HDRRRFLVKLEDHPHCWAMVPPPTPRKLPNTIPLSMRLNEAHEALGALQAAAASLPNADLITRTLSRREAVLSSQIEGTKTQIPELFEYEVTRGADDKTPDTAEVERYVKALEAGLESLNVHTGRKGITLELIKRMHAILLDGASDDLSPGQFRAKQAWIGSGRLEDATFVPPPPANVPACMRELESAMLQYQPREDEMTTISIVTQMAIAHAQFETIHPFADGNGRVGRLILPLIMAAEGYPPLYLSGYLARYRRTYFDALADVQLKGQWNKWGLLFCEAVIQSAKASIAVATDLNAIHDQWVETLSDLRKNAAARRFPQL
ncbi:hypothetical protein KCV01_g24784, partial [Aureobasidium melanogenum]